MPREWFTIRALDGSVVSSLDGRVLTVLRAASLEEARWYAAGAWGDRVVSVQPGHPFRERAA